MYVWDLVEGGCVAKLDSGVGRGPVHSLAPHPTKPQLLTAAQGTVVVWDVDKGDDEEEMEVEPTLSSSSGTQLYINMISSSILLLVDDIYRLLQHKLNFFFNDCF